MANRIFIGGVLLLWSGSMAWLVVEKVLPSFRDGTPPVASGFELDEPVAWRVEWSGQPAGWAASIRKPGLSGTTELHNRVKLNDVPLLDLAPAWMRQVVGEIGSLSFDASTLLEFDTLDRFSGFRSSIGVNDFPGVLTVRGAVEDNLLNLTIRSGEMKHSFPVELQAADQQNLSESLFPDAKIPYLYVGRRWREETYNPFSSPRSPVEVVEAEVISVETVEYGDEVRRAMRVEFKSPHSAGIPDENRLQAVAWVAPEDGTVMRQDVYIDRIRLRFNRLAPEEALDVAGRLLKLDGADRSGPQVPRDEPAS